MMLHAIDLHKRSLEVATMRADGEGEPRVVRMPACERALGSYLRQWPASRHRVVVETTGSWRGRHGPGDTTGGIGCCDVGPASAGSQTEFRS